MSLSTSDMAMTNMNIAPMTNTLVIDTIAITLQVMRFDSLLFFLFILGQRYNNSLKAQNFQGKMLLLLKECLDAVGDVLLEVVEEEAVVVEMVALGAEHLGAVGGDGVELGVGDGGDND